MSRGKELGVGVVILAALAVAVIGTLWLQGTSFGRTLIPVEALLESVGQLTEGNAVTYRGVKIGQVGRVAVEPDGSAVRITLLLDQAVQLPEDPAVVVGPESMFGAWQAEILRRSSQPRYPFFDVPEGQRTRPGLSDRAVPVLGGYALPEISRLTASAEEISLNLADLTARLELAFNQETADNLARAIINIQGITEEVRLLVAQQGELAASITANADSALAEITTAATAARASFERIESIATDAQLDSVVANLTSASGGLRDVMAQLADTTSGIGVTLERADSTFVRLDRLTARLEAGEGSLGRLLTDDAFALRAESVLEQLDLLLKDLRENPARYVRFSIF